MLEAVNLCKSYEGEPLVLDNVSFQVNNGEIFCIFGANGAGKTTTINLFLNFIDPSSGKALVDGIDVTEQPLKCKSLLSFVSENVMLYDNFSAYQNLDYFTKLAGNAQTSRNDFRAVLEQVGLDVSAHESRVRHYSKGMRRKLGIAIAMLKNAPNVLLDEPTSGLDPKAGVEFLELLRSLKAQQKAIFISTHDIFRAKIIADRIGFLKEGRLVMMRTKEQLAGEDLNNLYMEYMQTARGEEGESA